MEIGGVGVRHGWGVEQVFRASQSSDISSSEWPNGSFGAGGTEGGGSVSGLFYWFPTFTDFDGEAVVEGSDCSDVGCWEIKWD